MKFKSILSISNGVKIMSSKLTKLEKEYNELYSNLPNTPEEMVTYLQEKYPVKSNKLIECVNNIQNMEWKTVRLVLPIIPHPSPRPRSSSDGHFYVKGAKEHRMAIRNMIRAENIICTAVKIRIDIYQPIPVNSMTNMEIHLANMGLLRPISGGDWDNFAKTYCDAIQGYLILNDNIIIEGTCAKYYALKPLIVITMEYAENFDSKFNRRKIVNSVGYKKLSESNQTPNV